MTQVTHDIRDGTTDEEPSGKRWDRVVEAAFNGPGDEAPAGEADDANYLWFYGSGRDPDEWFPAESMSDAMALGTTAADLDGEYTIVEATVAETDFDCFTAPAVLADLTEFNDGGVFCQGRGSVSSEAMHALDLILAYALAAWAEKYGFRPALAAFDDVRNFTVMRAGGPVVH